MATNSKKKKTAKKVVKKKAARKTSSKKTKVAKASKQKVAMGMKAPDFTLPGSDGKDHTLSGQSTWTLVYFYPKDNTPGCTVEAEMFRDTHADFKKRKIAIWGISPDSMSSHIKFRDKFNLPFVLLSDVDKKVVRAYGVWGKKKFMGREYLGTFRHSFLVRPDGVVFKTYTEVKPALHAHEVLADFDAQAKG
jgi:peroxiredoxin Q/BCP